jgi:hypothetical protein
LLGKTEKTMTVVRDRLRAREEDKPLIHRYLQASTPFDQLSKALGTGRVEFQIAANTPGCAGLALSIWREDGLFPLDHLVRTVRVEEPDAPVKCDEAASEARGPLRGGLATLLDTSLARSGGSLRRCRVACLREPHGQRRDLRRRSIWSTAEASTPGYL